MSYRIVILNGERRGERWEMDRAPLTVGRGGAAGIQLEDPEVATVHAELRIKGDMLFIRPLDPTTPVRVNAATVGETHLQHGDVVQIGNTRLFIQTHESAAPFEGLQRWQRARTWLTLAVPILTIALLALLIPRCRRPAPPPPPPPAPAPVMSIIDMHPEDSAVTNIARIRIDPAVTLTSHPPDVVEALEIMAFLRTNPPGQEVDIARQELDQATRFLKEQEQPEAPTPSQTSTNLPTEPSGVNEVR